MLRTNLSTRPFYNGRAVRIGLGVIAIVAVALTVYDVAAVWRLRAQGAEQRTVAAANEAEARTLRDQARVIRQSLDKAALEAVQTSAREANDLIDRRAFSWTDLFNRFEQTLPADVRITGVTPQVDNEGRLLVAVTVISRKVEDLNEFIEALEKTGSFSQVLQRQENAEDDGTRRTLLQGFYNPPAQPAPPSTVPAPPASEPDKGPSGNKTAAVAGGAGAGR